MVKAYYKSEAKELNSKLRLLLSVLRMYDITNTLLDLQKVLKVY